MDLKAATTAFLRGCFDSIRGISAIFSMNDDVEDKTRKMSPFRNSNFRGDTPERIKTPAKKKKKESVVKSRLSFCCLMNGGIFLLSIFVFEFIHVPFTDMIHHYILGHDASMRTWIWSWIKPTISNIFTFVWLVPLYFLSKIVNSLLFQDIADSAYRHSRGRPLSWQSLSVWLADWIFSFVVQCLFLIQATLVSFIPIYSVGYIFSLIHMCLLYSLYAFEYKWFNMGWELHRRLAYIERNWPYFAGFGFPLSLLTQMFNSWIISGAIFSLLFPCFIISGNESNPVDDVQIYPLRLFSPVVALTNMIFSKTIGKKTVKAVVRSGKFDNTSTMSKKYKINK